MPNLFRYSLKGWSLSCRDSLMTLTATCKTLALMVCPPPIWRGEHKEEHTSGTRQHQHHHHTKASMSWVCAVDTSTSLQQQEEGQPVDSAKTSCRAAWSGQEKSRMDSHPVTCEDERDFRLTGRTQRASASARLLGTSKEGQEWSRNRLEENIHAMAAKNSARRCCTAGRGDPAFHRLLASPECLLQSTEGNQRALPGPASPRCWWGGLLVCPSGAALGRLGVPPEEDRAGLYPSCYLLGEGLHQCLHTVVHEHGGVVEELLVAVLLSLDDEGVGHQPMPVIELVELHRDAIPVLEL